ncbi:MAG: nucleotidyltransferase family protein [Rhodobacteraceae bacterium]|nr:nucleotidyltransferase family protein [Paracoccaceae bacterium]
MYARAKKSQLQPGIFPSGRLHYLVKAACASEDIESDWQAYHHALANDYPNEGELRIFPLIADRLGEVTEHTPLIKHLNSSRRWARMQTMINRQLAIQTGEAFKNAGIPLMWTKGHALVRRVDNRPELRPSSDIDGIIKWENVDQIGKLADQLGWKSKFLLVKNRQIAWFRNSEMSFHVGNSGLVDLSWQPRMPFTFDPFVNDWIWQHANPAVDAQGIPFANDTWLLLETIEHGLRANSVYPIRWLVDAVRLIERRHRSIDWDMLEDIAKRYKLQLVLGTGLTEISKYSTLVPDQILENLSNFRPTAMDREEHRARTFAPDNNEGHTVSFKINQLRRAPFSVYRKSPLNPIGQRGLLSPLSRGKIALLNILARLTTPFVQLITLLQRD